MAHFTKIHPTNTPLYSRSKMQLLLSTVFPCWQKGQIWGREKKNKRREVSHQGLLLLLFWIFILLLQWSQLDLFLRNSHYLSRGTKTAWVFFRNFSYWCALNTVVYRSFALCVKPEIPCFDTCVLCKLFVLSRSKRYIELPLSVPYMNW